MTVDDEAPASTGRVVACGVHQTFLGYESLSRLKKESANGDSKEVSEWWSGAEARGQHTSDGGRGEWLVQMEEQEEDWQGPGTQDEGLGRREEGLSVLQSPLRRAGETKLGAACDGRFTIMKWCQPAT